MSQLIVRTLSVHNEPPPSDTFICINPMYEAAPNLLSP